MAAKPKTMPNPCFNEMVSFRKITDNVTVITGERAVNIAINETGPFETA
jgi:hypothetical protein